MHEPVYSTYCGEVGNDRTLAICIEPCFGTTLKKFEGIKIYWYTHDRIFEDEATGEREVFIASETQWIVEILGDNFFRVIVTEWTQTLQTPFGDEMNNIINQKVREAQEEYRRRKQTEKRLYFYDAKNGKLKLYVDNISYYNCRCRYQLDRSFTQYHAIDKRYSVPKESCFILGKIRRTIGTKNRKLMDFIEPVSEFELDYGEREEDYFFGEEEICLRNQSNLGNQIFKMLRFSIQENEPTGLTALRIQNKMHCTVQKFLKELDAALEAGDVKKVKEFCDVVNEPQDCSEQKFVLMKDEFGEAFEEGEELYCDTDDRL